MPRLFVAISLPQDHREHLLAQRPRLEHARFESVDKLHVTLRFIGDVGEQDASAIELGLALVSVPPFELELDGAGVFPSRGPPRVLWVGIKKSPTLERLAADVEAACVAAGAKEETRPFHAHVTLARLQPGPANKPAIQAASTTISARALQLSKWPVTSFDLIESTLSRSGSTYRVRRTFSLKPA